MVRQSGADFYLPFFDPTQNADNATGVLDDPQVIGRGRGGADIPYSLRSNRYDVYTRFMYSLSNVVSFPIGFGNCLMSAVLWIAGSCFAFNTLMYSLTLTTVIWIPWSVYGVAILSVLVCILALCQRRPQLIPFALLRVLLLCMGVMFA